MTPNKARRSPRTAGRTAGGKAEAVELTPEGRHQGARLAGRCDEGSLLMRISVFARTRTLVLLALAWVSIMDVSDPVRCATYEEQTPGRLQTICTDGTRAVSTWSPTMGRWTTLITPPPGQTCTGQLNPRTQQVEVHCR
jgi:hypothetical protein